MGGGGKGRGHRERTKESKKSKHAQRHNAVALTLTLTVAVCECSCRLEENGNALAATDACGAQGVLGNALVEAVCKVGQDAGTRHAEWVTNSNGTTVDVQPVV